jgi:hypothetical protein
VKRRVAPLVLAAALLAGAGTAAAAPPEPISGTFTSPCPGFNATLTVTGKTATISLPGGRFKVISPDQKVTITGPSAETVSYVITGVTHVEIQPDGSYAVTATGPNVVLVPKTKSHPAGLFLTTGTVSWTLNPDGSERTLFSSQGGQVTDVCALIK